jgi:hypothetical protein
MANMGSCRETRAGRGQLFRRCSNGSAQCLVAGRSAGAAVGGLRWSFGLGRAFGGVDFDDVAERWTCVKRDVGTL